ncbi:serine protease inhibitor [Geomicrobium sp. JCM 19038]|nr:serine protease inhibitor [Geomicrobium sp. JCM 19038]
MAGLTGCGVTSSEQVNANLEESLEQNRQLEFAVQLVDHEDEGNHVMSPFSIYLSLMMVANGTSGDSEQEIYTALQLDDVDREEENRKIHDWLTYLSMDRDVEIGIANSIWAKEHVTFLERYVATIEDTFYGEARELTGVKGINDWVSGKTKGEINRIVEEELSESIVALLVNATYFYGEWQFPFTLLEGHNEKFTNLDGSVESVEWMNRVDDFRYVEGEQYQAVQLSYADEETSLKIVLPDEGAFTDVLHEIPAIMSNKKWSTEEVNVQIPTFELDHNYNLNNVLQQLGMETIFTYMENNMFEENKMNYAIDDVIHKATIEVDEKGTEAAAATAVSVIETSASMTSPINFTANRPFYFLIEHEPTGATLFFGSYAEVN